MEITVFEYSGQVTVINATSVHMLQDGSGTNYLIIWIGNERKTIRLSDIESFNVV